MFVERSPIRKLRKFIVAGLMAQILRGRMRMRNIMRNFYEAAQLAGRITLELAQFSARQET